MQGFGTVQAVRSKVENHVTRSRISTTYPLEASFGVENNLERECNAMKPKQGNSRTIDLALSGDKSAFGELVELHAAMVTGVAYSVLGDFAQSEDAGQEAFLEAWRKRETLKDPSKFASWVCAIARHRALDIVRKMARHSERLIEADSNQATDCAPSAEMIAFSEEEKQLVWQSLDSMPETYRDVMVLYYRGGESVAQVAESLGESEANIRQRLVRGRQILKSEVESIVNRTLRGTAPKAAFVAVVVGNLTSSASAAVVGTVATAATTTGSATMAAGKAGSGATAKSAAATFLSGASGGALLGTLGGFLGGGLGTYLGYSSAPFTRQKQLILRYFAFTVVWGILLSVAVAGLVAKQRSDNPLDPRAYGLVLLSTIIGFQLALAGLSGWMIWRYRQFAAEAQESGEPLHPDAARRVSARPPARVYRYTSERKLLGRPLVDIQQGAAALDGTVAEPLTARGWIAIGDRAHGVVLGVGSRAYGAVAIGGLAFGGLTLGGVGVGVLNLCGISIGLVSLGGVSVGWLALGGLSCGVNAMGGLAIGVNAVGGAAFGFQHAVGGMAWSKGFVEAGLVLAGESGDESKAQIARHWFMKLANRYR